MRERQETGEAEYLSALRRHGVTQAEAEVAFDLEWRHATDKVMATLRAKSVSAIKKRLESLAKKLGTRGDRHRTAARVREIFEDWRRDRRGSPGTPDSPADDRGRRHSGTPRPENGRSRAR